MQSLKGTKIEDIFSFSSFPQKKGVQNVGSGAQRLFFTFLRKGLRFEFQQSLTTYNFIVVVALGQS